MRTIFEFKFKTAQNSKNLRLNGHTTRNVIPSLEFITCMTIKS